MNILLASLILCTGSLLATSALEEAVIASDLEQVRILLTDLEKSEKPLEDKRALLKQCSETAEDVITELRDTIEPWNTWSDMLKLGIGSTLGLHYMLRFHLLYDQFPKFPSKYWQSYGLGAALLYVGIRGWQCTAQLHQLDAPRVIKQLLADELLRLENDAQDKELL